MGQLGVLWVDDDAGYPNLFQCTSLSPLTYTSITGGGGGGAPTDAEYIVGALNASLTNERLVTDTPTIAWDLATGGQAKANVPDNSITDAKLRDSAALSVLGRAAGTVGDPADIVASANDRILRRVGGALDFGQLTAGMFPNSIITDAMLRNSAALSVIGRSVNSAGAPADIAAGADDRLLRRVAGALDFGQLTVGMAPSNIWTLDRLAQIATARFLGRTTAGTGNVEELTTAQATALLDLFTSALKGLVPASGGGTTNFLRADGTWAAPPGGGASPQGVLEDAQFSVLSSSFTLGNVNTVQSCFPAAQDVFTVEGNTTYFFEALLIIQSGTTTHTTGFGFSLGGGASLTAIDYITQAYGAAANAISTAQSSKHTNVATVTAFNATSTSARWVVQIQGVIRVNAAGNITPQIQFSAAPGGTNQMVINSYLKLYKVGNGSVVVAGGWA